MKSLGRVERDAPIDPKRDYSLVTCKVLGPEVAGEPSPAMLVATFATDRARIDHVEALDEFVRVFRNVEGQRDEVFSLRQKYFLAVLAATIVGGVIVALIMSGRIARRVTRVADAARRVAAGDLSVRVPEQGSDEAGELAVSFNRMLGDLETSRARIEYLQRIGAWQDMARRLAHEIKNPLTPIQLAVEECHSKYSGDDPRLRRLLDTTLEIVTEEVGTLRRLVTEFSDFARLPRARLHEHSLVSLFDEFRPALERLALGTELSDQARLTPSGGYDIPVRVVVEALAPGTTVSIAVDKQMLRKTLDNLVRNAVQAIRAAGKGQRVVVSARLLDDLAIAIDVDDDGPGVAPENRARVFDPYFTTRTEGTGLGLAIVKKIVVEHGGTIECGVSPFAGARFRIVLPSADSPEARAALEAGEAAVASTDADSARGD